MNDATLQRVLQPEAESAAPEEPATDVPPPASEPAAKPERQYNFKPGNTVGMATRFKPGLPGPALIHGRKSKLARQELLAAAAELLSEQRDQIVRDLGGDPSRISQDLVQRYVEADLLASHLGSVLTVEGILTSSGRTRRALTAYLALVAQQLKLAQALGLERQARQVASLAEVLRG